MTFIRYDQDFADKIQKVAVNTCTTLTDLTTRETEDKNTPGKRKTIDSIRLIYDRKARLSVCRLYWLVGM